MSRLSPGARWPAVVLAVALALGCSVEPRELGAGEDPLAPAEILAVAERVAGWQLAHPRHGDLEWTNAVFYSGLVAAYRVTGDDRYLAVPIEVGERHEWRIGPRTRHADDHALAQTYLELFGLKRDSRMLRSFREVADRMIAEPAAWPKEHQVVDYWWSDALFMSPPALAMLARATDDERYLELMDRLWRESYDLLYDRSGGLFHRDLRFREPQARFWSRGNAWVLAGLARLLEALPEDWPTRSFYETVFRDLSGRVVDLQAGDGLWRSDLASADSSRRGESSGSALFCYALAWGVNNEFLSAEAFRPAVTASWVALYRNVDAAGRLGWVQKPGAKPARASSRDWEVYGSGAFLLAAEQVLDLQAQ